MFKIQTTEFTETSKGVFRANVDYEYANVRILKFAAGAEIPKHAHKKQALHIITKGKLELDDGQKLHAIGNGTLYACGGWEYRARAMEDTEVVVIESKD